MASSVPIINITSDKEEDDDHHIFTMGEVATDIEDLDESSQQLKKTKPKLVIKVNDDLGRNTDVEDIQGSDSEDCAVIITYKKKLCITNFNIDSGVVEETCKINDKMEKTNYKIHSQKSLTPQIEKSSTEFGKENILTDMENISGDDSESSSSIPDIEINPELYEGDNNTSTKDAVKYSLVATPSPCATPLQYLSENESNEKQKKINNISTMKLTVSMFQFANVTDIEMLDSDVENDNQIAKKTKKIKKRRPKNKNQIRGKDSYYNEEIRRHSYKKNDGTTDIEEFEADSSVAAEYIYDNSALNKELEKMQCLYGPTKEKHSYKRSRGKISDFNNLSDESDQSYKKHTKARNYKKENRQTYEERHNLRLPESYNACLTDVEDVPSSENESYTDKVLSEPKEKNTSDDLTEEELIIEGDDYLTNLPDFKLPEAKREVVVIKENDTKMPTVVITPLKEETPLGLIVSEEEATDTENISARESDFEDIDVKNKENPGNISIKLDEFENETTEEREFIKSSKQAMSIRSIKTDAGTDTEEITLNIEKKGKEKRITLLNERQEKTGLTDTEDIYFSDGNKTERKFNSRKHKGYLVDSELTQDSDDDVCIRGRAIIHIVANSDKDSDHSNTKYQNNNAVNSALSDSDDMGVSNEDLSHSEASIPGNLRKELDLVSSKIHSKDEKVNPYSSEEIMYLKGGSYDILSDMEFLSGDEICEGWSAPDGQSRDKPTEAVAKQGAALQGESYVTQQRTEQQSTPQTLARAEAEESASQIQTEQDRPIADQHMLSDEMKRLLKELEEESKK